MDRKWPVIIAMQGDPYTGKTTLANYLSFWMKYPTIRLDEIIDVLSPDEPTGGPKAEKLDALMSRAFDFIVPIVKAQTSLEISVVIDSPLSRRSHLETLTRLVTDAEKSHFPLSLVIIECKPKIEYAWQLRFEARNPSYDTKWYKPHDWPMGPEFTRDYTDDAIHPLVSRLVVDTTDHVMIRHLVEAVHDISACGEGHKVEFSEWRPIHKNNPHTNLDYRHHDWHSRAIKEKEAGVTGKGFCRGGHLVDVYREGGIDYDADCGVCQAQVSKSSGGVYTCRYCPLAIHGSCAELAVNNKAAVAFVPEEFPKFLERETSKEAYCFPKEYLCPGCEEEGKEFSYECESCIFETHMKSRLVPTIVHHKLHEHRLFFSARSISSGGPYLCAGCRQDGSYVTYGCKECSLSYHPECVLLPIVLEAHKHGGYAHDMHLLSCWKEKQEDYVCQLCLEKMNPKAWYYHCHDCSDGLPLHLDCAFKDFDA